MFNRYLDLILVDSDYGECAVRADSVPYDNIHVSYFEFENSPRIKAAGGCFCLYCKETGNKKFYRSDYMAMNALNKFIEDNKKVLKKNDNRS